MNSSCPNSEVRSQKPGVRNPTREDGGDRSDLPLPLSGEAVEEVEEENAGAGAGKSENFRFPRATFTEDLRQTRLWILPALALLLTLGLAFQAFSQGPIPIVVHFREGHGIKPGDAVKFRGIDVGKVSTALLSTDLQEIILCLEIESGLTSLVSQGSSFWIVHPRAGLYGVQGLETIIGPRYIGVSPGQGSFQPEFIGLEEAPIQENPAGGLEIVLQADFRGSLRPGAPVHYRQVPIGSVVSVGLAPDSVSVEIRVWIEPRFVGLIRESTRFWNASGLVLDFGLLKGFSFDMESIQTLLAGGICLATPDNSGNPVTHGHRFTLCAKPELDWLAWHPALWLGDSLLPAGASLPATIRIQASWTDKRLGGLWQEARLRRGWALPLPGGLVCPADLCSIPGDPGRKPALQALGRSLKIPTTPVWASTQLAMLPDASLPNPWPMKGLRRPASPEDCCAVGDPLIPPIPLQANRLRPAPDGTWLVDSALGLPVAWHGAVVMSRGDGKVLGMLIAKPGEPVRVALYDGP